jgi:UDP-N-acetylmuramate--alanine ligase
MTRQLAAGSRVHLVGIGGAGMSALAHILLERGHRVSGSDLRGGRICAALAAMGADVHIGHDAEHVGGADLVAVSTAVPPDNPEVVRAGELNLPVLRRAELLAVLMAGRRGLVITGTHGKTTTTSMAVVCLQAAGLDPSFAIGGVMHEAGTSAHEGTGDVFVAEGDESDRSFLLLEPHCAVVTNVEHDHHDQFEDFGAVREAFERFLERRVARGSAILCRDDPGAARLAAAAAPPVITYGEHPESDVRIVDLHLDATGTRFRLRAEGADLGIFMLQLHGRHNVLNATGALVAARWAGAPPDAARQALAGFPGAQRRFQRLGSAAGVTVVDDYAHHPSELRAVLAAARQAHPDGRIIAAFQPHLYSRTAALTGEFGDALSSADVVLVTDVYGAREAPVPGVTGALVVEATRSRGTEVRFVPAAGDLPAVLAELTRPGDLVLTLGAGDITEAGPVLLGLLEGGGG